AGQTLGLAGSSGDSSGPHLCFQVYHNGDPMEVEDDPSTFWVDPLPYQGTVRGVLSAGVTTADADVGSFFAGIAHPVAAAPFTQDDGQVMTVWFAGDTQDGDTVDYRFYAPDGTEDAALDQTYTAGEMHSGWFSQDIDVPAGLDLGTWEIGIEINGA